jgi:acyl-ACP thioesterase
MMEESACLSADELQFGYNVLAPKNVGFILVNWHLELARPITLGEKLTLATWPIKPRKLIVFRDFELFVGDEKVGVGTTRWCMVDLSSFKMLPTSTIFENDYREYNDFRSIDIANWKIPEINCDECTYTKKVTYSDYDHYFHVNNTKYADFVLDVFDVDELKNKYISSAQMTYVKQCKCGEDINFYKSFVDGKWIVEGKVGDEIRVQFMVNFNEV